MSLWGYAVKTMATGGFRKGTARFIYHAAILVGRCIRVLNPFRSAVPFLRQASHISSSLSPKRDSGSKGVSNFELLRGAVVDGIQSC